MSFKRYDVITFEENDKVVVLESLLEKYKVLEVDYQNGTLNKITDVNLLSTLIPLFQEALSKYN